MATIDFGIDLGTTNSSVASCRRGEVRIYQTTELMSVTPSVVYIGKSGRMLVGKKAYDTWTSDPQNTQAEFKRWMGFSDTLTFPASDKKMSAEELSAEVLKSLRADVQRATNEELTAAVITVPAAFGSLQCEATGRAAKLAGFLEAPLLQEPIAAAVAYGASAGGKSQRWMVFDLGGGTLDIAIVSTRNDRLAVLEHQGNNRLGGKDMDRAIAEKLILDPLARQFKLPDRNEQPTAHDRLFRHLVRFAEQAKIALSTSDSAQVDIFNLGDDLAGAPIEATLTLTRADVDREIDPQLAKCIDLANRALDGARLSAKDIDRVLLVGGPTQMPAVRAALVSALGDKLDYSLDPMTVVAQGAALYASTLDRTVGTTSTPAAANLPAAKPGTVELHLNHERASGTPQSPVAGTILTGTGLHEVKIDAEGGVWSSGWIPIKHNRFVTEVLLTAHKPVTRFLLTGRSSSGAAIPLSPPEFAIAYMLPMSAPPLPHTIAIELASLNEKDAFDPVFKRHTPLPAEARRTYRADRTLRPSDVESTLPIKLWEIEVSEDPQEKWWAGCVHIRADKLKRPLMEGTELELTIKIDKSRKLTVDVFIPTLNQGFSNDVFVPDPPSTRSQLQQQLDLCFARVHRVFTAIYAGDHEEMREHAEAIQLKLEVIAEKISDEEVRAKNGTADPDALLAPAEILRKLRVMLTQMEEQLESNHHQSPFTIALRAEHRWTNQIVEHHGTQVDRDVMTRLTEQLHRYIEVGDQRGLRFVQGELRTLRATVVHDQPWYWENQFNWLRQPGRRYLNQAEAQQLLTKGQTARDGQNLPALREAIYQIWKLVPPDQVEQAKEQSMQSGIKGN